MVFEKIAIFGPKRLDAVVFCSADIVIVLFFALAKILACTAMLTNLVPHSICADIIFGPQQKHSPPKRNMGLLLLLFFTFPSLLASARVGYDFHSLQGFDGVVEFYIEDFSVGQKVQHICVSFNLTSIPFVRF